MYEKKPSPRHVLKFGNERVDTFASLIERLDLKSPYRSTVPLLAYWNHPATAFPSFCAATGVPKHDDGEVSFSFEFNVPPVAGRGRPSCTDIMIRDRFLAIAVEGKYKEPPYETTRVWIRSPVEPNRKLVLNGWLRLINNATDASLEIAQLLDFPYQLIHRTASACSQLVERPTVVYHCFDPSDELSEYYRRILQAFGRIINAPDRIAFFFYATTMKKNDAYRSLELRWDNGERDLAAEVRKLLINAQIATFCDPVVVGF